MKNQKGIRGRRTHSSASPQPDRKKPLGRKSRLKEGEMLHRLCRALEDGNTYENACTMAGIGRTTFYRWMSKAKGPPLNQQFRDFRDMVKRAGAIAEHRNVVLIQKAAANDWRAAAWWLERRNPEQYGRRKVIAGLSTSTPVQCRGAARLKQCPLPVRRTAPPSYCPGIC